MEKGIQEVIQIFCPICSRGVIVRNESMFRCKQCGRDVCRACFDREERLCLECVGEGKPHDLRRAREQGPGPAARPEPAPAAEARPRGLVWLVVTGLVLFAAGLMTSIVPAIPFWAGLASAAVGVGLLARGLIGLLRM